MTKPTNDFLQKFLTLLGFIYSKIKYYLSLIFGDATPSKPNPKTSKNPLPDDDLAKKAWLFLFVIWAIVFIFYVNTLDSRQKDEISYGRFMAYVKDGKIDKATTHTMNANGMREQPLCMALPQKISVMCKYKTSTWDASFKA